MWATGITYLFVREEMMHMSNDVLMLLFEDGLFLISLLTLIVILIEKISKK